MKHKTLGRLALLTMGIAGTIGSWKLIGNYAAKTRHLREKIPARVYQVDNQIQEIESMPSKNLLKRISEDPNFSGNYNELLAEQKAYDCNSMISNVELEIENRTANFGIYSLPLILSGFAACSGARYFLKRTYNFLKKKLTKD